LGVVTAAGSGVAGTHQPWGGAQGYPHLPGETALLRVRLLDGFALESNGVTRRLPPAAQRVLAFLSLYDRPLERAYVAGALWLDSSDERAHANLRSALWRLRQYDRELVDASGSSLKLGAAVAVDLRESHRIAHEVLTGGPPAGDSEAHLVALAGDVLPDWYEDWVLFERERHRQLRLRALEVLCELLTATDRLSEALEAGLSAVAGEPLRESAHRALVRVHLATGNASEAVRVYRLYRQVLHEQLGIEPSPLMEELVAGLRVPEACA
jgi:DNA-binding SARP family transcriptional activator